MQNKIKDALPNPTQCDACCSLNIELTTNDRIYGKRFGDWPYCWFCNDCRATVGCHPHTNIPLGRMADRVTRALRKKAHEAFDVLWHSGYMTRTKAYRWLAIELGIDFSSCHISWLTKEQLKTTAEISRKHISENANVLRRRRIKNDARQAKRDKRQHAAERRHKNSR